MSYWLMKSEPETFNLDLLYRKPKKTDHWEGVRNYQARNFMRDDMKKGDLAFFYHSNCKEPGITGIVEIVREAYPDFTAWDPDSKYYDPQSSPENPRWVMVDVCFKQKFKSLISLQALRNHPLLEKMVLLKKGSRLSITPVTPQEWNVILKLDTQ